MINRNFLILSLLLLFLIIPHICYAKIYLKFVKVAIINSYSHDNIISQYYNNLITTSLKDVWNFFNNENVPCYNYPYITKLESSTKSEDLLYSLRKEIITFDLRMIYLNIDKHINRTKVISTEIFINTICKMVNDYDPDIIILLGDDAFFYYSSKFVLKPIIGLDVWGSLQDYLFTIFKENPDLNVSSLQILYFQQNLDFVNLFNIISKKNIHFSHIRLFKPSSNYYTHSSANIVNKLKHEFDIVTMANSSLHADLEIIPIHSVAELQLYFPYSRSKQSSDTIDIFAFTNIETPSYQSFLLSNLDTIKTIASLNKTNFEISFYPGFCKYGVGFCYVPDNRKLRQELFNYFKDYISANKQNQNYKIKDINSIIQLNIPRLRNLGYFKFFDKLYSFELFKIKKFDTFQPKK